MELSKPKHYFSPLPFCFVWWLHWKGQCEREHSVTTGRKSANIQSQGENLGPWDWHSAQHVCTSLCPSTAWQILLFIRLRPFIFNFCRSDMTWVLSLKKGDGLKMKDGEWHKTDFWCRYNFTARSMGKQEYSLVLKVGPGGQILYSKGFDSVCQMILRFVRRIYID